MNNEEKLEQKTDEEPVEESVELTKEDVKKVQKAIKTAQLDATKLSEKNQELFEKIMETADMPIAIDDKDIRLGKQELDVRGLSRTGYRQMEFRQLVLNNVYLKQVVMSLTDITRLLMVIADKLGVEDIVGATDDIIDKIEAKEKEKQESKLN